MLQKWCLYFSYLKSHPNAVIIRLLKAQFSCFFLLSLPSQCIQRMQLMQTFVLSGATTSKIAANYSMCACEHKVSALCCIIVRFTELMRIFSHKVSSCPYTGMLSFNVNSWVYLHLEYLRVNTVAVLLQLSLVRGALRRFCVERRRRRGRVITGSEGRANSGSGVKRRSEQRRAVVVHATAAVVVVVRRQLSCWRHCGTV